MVVSVPMAAAVGFVVAMLVAVLLTATAGTGRSDRSRVRAAGGPLTLFGGVTVYLFVLLPIFSEPGITLRSLLLLIVAVVLPVLVARWVQLPTGARAGRRGTLRDAIGGVVAFALLAGQLAIAGAIMSLFGGVSRMLATGAFGIACAGYLLGSGRTGSIRTSRYAVVGAAIAVVILVIGLVLGSPATITTPLVSSTPMPVGTMVAVLLSVVLLGVFDPNLRSALTVPARSGRALVVGTILAAGAVLALGIGGILFFGGVMQAPNLEIMTVFAVLPPLGIMVMMLVVTFLLASNVDGLLSAGAQSLTGAGDPGEVRPATVVLALVAIVVAVLVPNPTLFLVLAAVVAAASVGALAPAWRRRDQRNPWPSFVAGSVGAIIVGVVLGTDEVVGMTGTTAIVLVVAAVIAGLTTLAVGAIGGSDPSPVDEESGSVSSRAA